MSQTTPPDKDKIVGLPRQPKEPATEQAEPAKVLPFEKPRRRCEVPGCTNPHQARGRCMAHYHQWRKTNQLNCDLLCTKCGVHRRWHGHSWCRECNNERARALFFKRYSADPIYYSARRIKNLAYNLQLKLDVIEGYAAKTGQHGCSCPGCGVSEISMLQLDHVKGLGNAERRTAPGGWVGVYRRAKREGFPADLQILCANCNFSKAALGRCTHELAAVAA
jgi:hypothetical protein